MKVLDLRCANGHRFEGWFDGEVSFLDQNERGLVGCPVCDDRAVTRLPSAPRLNLGAGEPAAAPAAADADGSARLLRALREVLARTEDVGERFCEEARRIHYGESPERGIRGQATEAQRDALLAEGIEVQPLLLPAVLKDRLQ